MPPRLSEDAFGSVSVRVARRPRMLTNARGSCADVFQRRHQQFSAPPRTVFAGEMARKLQRVFAYLNSLIGFFYSR